jgi:hypothetical protein
LIGIVAAFGTTPAPNAPYSRLAAKDRVLPIHFAFSKKTETNLRASLPKAARPTRGSVIHLKGDDTGNFHRTVEIYTGPTGRNVQLNAVETVTLEYHLCLPDHISDPAAASSLHLRLVHALSLSKHAKH